MASAQVMSNSVVSSRKQKDLEAGRRRLEEFRKQKAAKKKTSACQPLASTSITSDIQVAEKEPPLASEGAGTSGRTGYIVDEPVTEVANDAKTLHSFSCNNGVDSINRTFSNFPVPENNLSSDQPQKYPEQQKHTVNDASELRNLKNSDNSQQKGDELGGHGLHFVEGRSVDESSIKLSNYPGIFAVNDSQLDKSRDFLGIAKIKNSFPYKEASLGTDDGLSSENHSAISLPALAPVHALDFAQSKHNNARLCDNLEGRDSKRNSHIDDFPGSRDEVFSSQTSKLFKFDVKDSSGQNMLDTPEIYPRSNRPSFLDFLDIPKASSASSMSHSQPQKIESVEAPSTASTSAASAFIGRTRDPEYHSSLVDVNFHGDYTDNGFLDHDSYMNGMEKKFNYLPQKQNEDFASLEQHIEDLTQEKFSLHRALEASKTLAESLTAENSSLTESYNQQGSVVAQLKADIEHLQADIKALMAELSSVRIQYTNAQLECNAADERGKLLASEVIGLEEKALRLRSNELKLEEELERSNADMISCERKISRLEKERQDLHQTIDALKEEKKLLQLKLQKASAAGRSFDIGEYRHFKKDVSTSTEDLDDGISSSSHRGDNLETSIHDAPDASASSVGDADILSLSQPYGSFDFGSLSVMIPPDQFQIVENINVLLSELIAEKEELTEALTNEISASTKLKDLNKEITRKLEVQTQRMELLTSQKSMASQNAAAQPMFDTPDVQDNVVAYADEGDEVVERVLGWIMKLFPGGPSKRRTSKRL